MNLRQHERMKNTKNSTTRQTALQTVTRDWLLRGKPNAFVTLTFRPEKGVSFNYAQRVTGTFVHGMKAEMFGEKSKKRFFVVPVIEGYVQTKHKPRRTHIHCLMKLPNDPSSYMAMIRRVWLNSSPFSGDPLVYDPDIDQNDDAGIEQHVEKKWFKNIYEAGGAIDYVLKTCAFDTQAILWKFVPKLDA
jgi:hypothetical protein